MDRRRVLPRWSAWLKVFSGTVGGCKICHKLAARLDNVSNFVQTKRIYFTATASIIRGRTILTAFFGQSALLAYTSPNRPV